MERIHRLKELRWEDVVTDEKDFHSYMTGGFVVAGRELDLLKLKFMLIQLMEGEECQGFKLIHFQITPERLAIVKKEDWNQWKNQRG